MSYRSSTRCFAASLSTNNQSRSPQRHSASHVLPTIKRKRTFSEMDSSGYCPRSEGHGEATNSRRRFWTSAIQLRASDPSLRPLDLAAAIQERFAVNAHPRSIERALRRQKKKNVAESSCWRMQDSAGNSDLRLRRSTTSRRGFEFSWPGHGHFSWPGNGGMDAGVLPGWLYQSRQRPPVSDPCRTFAE